ncbi:MAG: winged helix-turn-helix domain-containing protein [Myxococcota bacterium]
MRLDLSGCHLDLDSRTASRDGAPLQLSRREWDLLVYLARRLGQAVGRDQLMVEVMGYSPSVNSRALDASVSRLRAKIEPRAVDPVHLVTVYGFGYRLDGVAREGSDTPATSASPAVAQVAERLARHGQVTLVGPPGVGKTHLAHAVVEHLGGRAAWIDLAGDPAPDEVRAALDRADLVVFDSAQVDPAAVAGWVAGPRRGAALITSRERLRWEGEVVHRVGELDVEAGAALFVEQAGRIGVHGFGPQDRSAIEAIVRSLDGIPLAIRYAATRTLVLSPAEIADELARDLDLIRSAETGSGTLAAAVGWTWDRLERWERAAVSQLAAFEGGFTLDAARRVVRLDDSRPLLDVVQALVDRCLCRRVGEGPRFAVYRAIREFATDRVTVVPYHRDALVRWVAWCAEVAGDPALARLEQVNLRAASMVAPILDPAAAEKIRAALP